jgi:glycosyltransferase involved in cell wall biosynthesis
MTVIFLDPGIRGLSGHHAHTVRALSQAVRERGPAVRILGHRALAPDVAEALGAEPLFSLSTYAVTSHDPVCWALETLVDGAALIADDLRRLEPAPGDVLVWPTARPHHIAAAARAMQAWPSPLFTVFTAGLPCVAPEDLYWRFACRRLPPDAPVVLAATADMMAEDYARAVGRPFQSAPFFHEGRARDRSGADPVVVGLLGHQRPSKGIHRLPAIIRRTQAGNVRWLVHDSGSDAEATLVELETLPNVQVLRGPVADWLGLLDRCDALLLPYDRGEYDRMHSGLLGEGIASGMPVVIPDTPGLLSQSEVAGRVVYKGDAPETVAAAVDALAQHFGELAKAAYRSAGHYAARNGPGRWAGWLLAQAEAAGFQTR